MAIYHGPDLHSQNTASNPVPYQPLDIEAWTGEAAQALAALSFSSPGGIRRNPEPLVIPLEEGLNSRGVDQTGAPHHADSSSAYRPRREPLRRDSLKRREALLKGKEGSRRRQRWENGSFMI